MYELMKKHGTFLTQLIILALNGLCCEGNCSQGYQMLARSAVLDECVMYTSDMGQGFMECGRECNAIRNCMHFIHEGNNCSVCLENGNVFEAHRLTMIAQQYTSATLVHKKLGYTPLPTDCAVWRTMGQTEDGVYTIYPDGVNQLAVYCDMTTDGGGWTVFQRRQDGSVDFQQLWAAYRDGFGDLSGEFWLGNEHVSLMTGNTASRLRVDLEDFSGETRYAEYEDFSILDESQKYTLGIGAYSGTVGDGGNGLSGHNGLMFTTVDSDNDLLPDQVCSYLNDGRMYGGFWFSICGYVFLNSVYPNSQYFADNNNRPYMMWGEWYTDQALRKSEFKFRPMQFP